MVGGCWFAGVTLFSLSGDDGHDQLLRVSVSVSVNANVAQLIKRKMKNIKHK